MAFIIPTDLEQSSLASGYSTGDSTIELNAAIGDTGGGRVTIQKGSNDEKLFLYSYGSRSGTTLSSVSFITGLDTSTGNTLSDENHGSGVTIFASTGRDYIKQVLDKFNSNERLTHEAGGIETDISGVTSGDILAGNGTGSIGLISLSHSDGNIIVSDGSTWVTESGGTARTSLGVAIGTDVQAHDAALDDISGISHSDGKFIVSDGSNWVDESDDTARTSLGVGTGDKPSFTGLTVDTDVFHVDDGNDRVGVGTTSPSHTVDIQGTSTPTLRIQDTTNSVSGAVRADDDSVRVGSLSSHDLELVTGGTTRVTLDTSGNLGIGTTTPDGPLDVEGGGIYVTEISAPSTPNSAKGVIYAKTDSRLYFKNDSGTERELTKQAADNIGDIDNVAISSVASGEVLKYDGSNWVNNTLSEAGIASDSHTHSAGDIDSGTLGAARLPTGGSWSLSSDLDVGSGLLYLDQSNNRWGLNQSSPASALHVTPPSGAAIQIDPYGSSGGNTGELRFLELAANGTNYVGFHAPDNIGSNVIWTLPSSDGSQDQVLTTDGSGTLSWASSSGISEVKDDSSPQLGGNLDLNGHHIIDTNGNEYLRFSNASSAVNELTLGNAATGNAPSLSATGDDTNIPVELDAKGTGNLILQPSATGRVGIGTDAPSSYADIETSGTVKQSTVLLELTNTANDSDMNGTGTSLRFRQHYNDATPQPVSHGEIQATTETDWTSTSSTQDSYMALFTALNGTLNERLRINSDGLVGINTTSPNSVLHIAPSQAGALQIDPFSTGSGNTGELRFLELAANGTNYTGFKAPDTLSGDVIYRLPTADGSQDQVLTTDGSGNLAWQAVSDAGSLSEVKDDTTPQLGGSLDLNGQKVIDQNSNDMLHFTATASAVNDFTFTNAATGNSPSFAATGNDTNIGLAIDGKGTGNLILQNSASGNVGINTGSPDGILDVEGTNFYLPAATSAPTDGSFANGQLTLWFDETYDELELKVKKSGGTVVTQTLASGGSIGGSDTELQYNNGGSFGGTTGVEYDDTSNLLRLTGNSGNVSDGTDVDSTDLVFRGYYDSDATASVSATARTITLRNTVEYATANGEYRLSLLDDSSTEIFAFEGDTGRFGINTSTPSALLHINPGQANALQIDPHNTNAGDTGEIRLLELSANGTNYVGVKAPDSISSSQIWTLPSSDGSSGQPLQTDGSGVLSFSALDVSSNVTNNLGLGNGGTGTSLSDPGADRIFFWDDGAGSTDWLTPNTGLAISGTNLNVTSGLDDIAGLTQSDGNFIVSDGTNWVVESGSTARTSLGAAASGSNSDITDMSGLTGALEAPTQINDGNSNEVLTFSNVASAVNEIDLTNAATGNNPAIAATGDDTNVGLTLDGKGSGDLILQNTASGNVGINVSSPTSLLDVQGGTGDYAFLVAGNSAPADGDFANSQYVLWLDESNDEFELKAKKSNGSTISQTVGSGGSGSPGGSDTELQYNNGGSFGGMSQWTYNDSNGSLSYTGDSDTVPLAMEANGTQTSDLFQITSNGGTAGDLFTVDNNGKVGILQTSPSANLHLSPDQANAFQIDPYGASSGNTGEIRLLELSANGSNYVGFKSPDSISSNQIWVLPSSDGSSNQFLQTDGSGTLTFATVDLANDVTGNLPLGNGGTGASLSDPGADRIFFWDDGAGNTDWLTPNTGLAISGTNLNVTGGLDDIVGLTQSDGNFIVSDGTNWVAESGSTARSSMGAAASGGNSDITSLTGLTGALQAPTQVEDGNGNEILIFANVASAVNEVTLTNAATGNDVDLSATGDDTNIDLAISGKGTGNLVIGSDVIPSTDNAHDLGSSSNRWADIYTVNLTTGDLRLHSPDGQYRYTLQEIADGVVLTNDDNGERYRMIPESWYKQLEEMMA